jgi:hypothetical protein
MADLERHVIVLLRTPMLLSAEPSGTWPVRSVADSADGQYENDGDGSETVVMGGRDEEA